jgi:hypothetical protein
MKEPPQFSAPDPSSSQSGPNRRREVRQDTTGTVEFDVIDEISGSFQGELIETSSHGMRMVHNCPRLERDMRIRFTHPYASGIARVVWNRRTGTSVESGFEIQD